MAIDPGRRDMVTMVSASDARERFRVSTREYRHNARISQAARVTSKILDVQDASLRAAMERLPCSRDFECWDAYLAAALPLVKAQTEALAHTCVRRARFASYMRRDRELDRICKEICGTSTKAARQKVETLRATDPSAVPTIVAFGAANTCSTGLGYAPAPQGRLRRRLAKVHGAKAMLMDEYMTSRICSCCNAELTKVYKSEAAAKKCADENFEASRRKSARRAERRISSGMQANPEVRRPVDPLRPCARPRPQTLVHGVLLRKSCEGRGGRPLFWHRDVNAARNILAVYLSLANDKTRPLKMRRGAPISASVAAPKRTGAAQPASAALEPASAAAPTKRARGSPTTQSHMGAPSDTSRHISHPLVSPLRTSSAAGGDPFAERLTLSDTL